MSKETGFHLFETETEEPEKVDTLDDHRYLVFSVGKVRMASPLLEVREVIEPVPFQHIPNTVSYFKGMANVRGEIVGVVDLSLMLNIQKGSGDREALVMFDTIHGAMGLLVEAIEGVHVIDTDQIEIKPHIKSKVPQEYLVGIAKQENGLVSVIQMKKILTDDDMITLRKKMAS